MMRNIDKRTLQSQLWLAQHNLSKCTDVTMIGVYRDYIRALASELLYRYREETKQLST